MRFYVYAAFLAGALLAIPARAQEASAPAAMFPQEDFTKPPEGRNFYRWSLAAVGAGNAADAFSSWHQSESNPLLARSGGNFNAQSLVIKAGLIGASLAIQRVALRRNRRLYKQFAWLNIAVGGGLGAAAAHNFNIR